MTSKLESNKGKNLPLYFLTIGIVIASFTIGGYFPMVYLFSQLGSQAQAINSTSDMASMFGLNTFFAVLLIPFVLAFFTLLACVKWIHKKRVISLFTSRISFDWHRFFFSFLVWGGIMSVFFIASFLFGAPILWNFNPATFFILFLISVLILPIQTAFEEIFFRGYLFQGFQRFFQKGFVSVLLTGILFGLMHGSNPEVEKIGNVLLLFYCLNGIFLGIIVLMDDGLELSLGYHTVNNIFAALVVTNEWQAFHTEALFLDKSPPSFGTENIVTLVIVQPLLLLLFARKYKWTNWKQRIFK